MARFRRCIEQFGCMILYFTCWLSPLSFRVQERVGGGRTKPLDIFHSFATFRFFITHHECKIDCVPECLVLLQRHLNENLDRLIDDLIGHPCSAILEPVVNLTISLSPSCFPFFKHISFPIPFQTSYNDIIILHPDVIFPVSHSSPSSSPYLASSSSSLNGQSL